MKNSFKDDFDMIKEMTDKIRSTGSLNESINFMTEYDDSVEDEVVPDATPEEPVGAEDIHAEETFGGEEEVNKIDQIREIALKGMVELCKNTEDPQYAVLKQIFNYCDKLANKKDAAEAE